MKISIYIILTFFISIAAYADVDTHTVDFNGETFDVYLDVEYRGTFMSTTNRCSGSISIWFFQDSEGTLRYYSTSEKAKDTNCIILGKDLAELSQAGTDRCAGNDFLSYKENNPVQLGDSNISFLRQVSFKEGKINSPSCDEQPRKVTEPTSLPIRLALFKTNGANGNIHIRITLPILKKRLQMNYMVTPIIK